MRRAVRPTPVRRAPVLGVCASLHRAQSRSRGGGWRHFFQAQQARPACTLPPTREHPPLPIVHTYPYQCRPRVACILKPAVRPCVIHCACHSTIFTMSNNQDASTESTSINESDFAAAIKSTGSIQDYNVLKAIGKGKFSVVYRAVEKATEKIVALKRIAIVDITDERQRQKTLKEVRLLQRLDHPNIIKYLDAFIDEHDLVIVFEWAEAGDLKRQLRKATEKKVRFDERLVWRYFSQYAVPYSICIKCASCTAISSPPIFF